MLSSRVLTNLLSGLHTIGVCNKGLSATKDLGAGLTPVNGRSVGIDCIRWNMCFATLHIENQKRRLVMLLEDGTIRHPSVLGSLLQCLLDGLGIHPTKQRTQLVIVWILNLEKRDPVHQHYCHHQYPVSCLTYLDQNVHHHLP